MNIETAIDKAGSINALSRILGVTRQAVQSYRTHGLPLPRLNQLKNLRPEWFTPKGVK